MMHWGHVGWVSLGSGRRRREVSSLGESHDTFED